MTIWTCKALITAGAITALAACEDGASFALATPQAKPLAKARMMAGKVTLVPPQGYCIDASSLKQRFALMARCDALNTDAGTGGAPVGIITASLAVLPEGGALPAAKDIAVASGLKNLRDVDASESHTSFRADGPAPDPAYSSTQWRGISRIGTVALGLTLHGPEGGRAITTEGREMLNDLITRTRTSSAASTG